MPDILHAFYSFALDILPLFIITLAVSAVATRYYPLRSLDSLIQRNSTRTVLTSAFFGVLLPVTPGCRIPMAAIARKGGASWTPLLIFIGGGAAAGISTIMVTSLIGWQFAILRLVLALVFTYTLSLILVRTLEPRLATLAMDTEIGPLFHRDYCEALAADSNADSADVSITSVWQVFLRLGRVVLPWLFLSMALAMFIQVAVPQQVVESFFNGSLAAPKAALIGLPFYFVAGSDVPLLLVLLKKGMGLGSATSLMLAAPVVNLPVLSMVSRWLGYRRALMFITICWIVASAIGTLFGYIDAR